MKLKLPFGIRDGKLVEISEVERGVACGCFCPACNHRLVAKKGNQIGHHFAHYKSSECVNALETALHLAAKDVLERCKKLRLPAVYTFVGPWYVQLHPEQTVEVDQVRLETRLNDMVPDLILDLRGRSLFVEIAVTHFIDVEKEEKIKNMNISTIEVDLANLDRQISLDVLEPILTDSAGRKRWIYNAKEASFRNRVQTVYGKEFPVIFRGPNPHVNDCPLIKRIANGRSYAWLWDDCSPCEYLNGSRGDRGGLPTHITCIGHARHEIARLVESYEKGGTLPFMFTIDR